MMGFKHLLLVCLLAYAGLAKAEPMDSITVQGRLQDTAAHAFDHVSLSFTDGQGERVYLRQQSQQGAFRFQIASSRVPRTAMLRVSRTGTPGRPSARLVLFLGQHDLQVQGNAWEIDLAEVRGDANNESYNQLRQSLSVITRQKATYMREIMAGRLKTRTPEGKAVMETVSRLNRQEAKATKEFIAGNPELFVSLYLLHLNRAFYTAQGYADAFQSLYPVYRQTPTAQKIAQTVQTESVTRKGIVPPDFQRITLQGDTLRLSELKGKVVLLDFWGSWCGPCRASMPHLKALYDKYKDFGFEILGIAQERGKTLEASAESWNKAITELELPWIQVLNNAGMDKQDIVEMYGISGFPTKILLDEKGRVILRLIASATDDLDEALQDIYNF